MKLSRKDLNCRLQLKRYAVEDDSLLFDFLLLKHCMNSLFQVGAIFKYPAKRFVLSRRCNTGNYSPIAHE